MHDESLSQLIKIEAESLNRLTDTEGFNGLSVAYSELSNSRYLDLSTVHLTICAIIFGSYSDLHVYQKITLGVCQSFPATLTNFSLTPRRVCFFFLVCTWTLFQICCKYIRAKLRSSIDLLCNTATCWKPSIKQLTMRGRDYFTTVQDFLFCTT